MSAWPESAAELLPLLAESPLDLARLTEAFARWPELAAAVLPGAYDPAAAIVLLGSARLRARLLAVTGARPQLAGQ
ncbi:MAG: hypothetical protein ACRD17_09215 [Terriglobales bacterium]